MPINTNYDMTIGVKLEVNDNYLRIIPANWITLLPERLLLSNNKKTIKGYKVKVITKLPNSEQSYKGKVQTHNYINRQNQSTTGKL